MTKLQIATPVLCVLIGFLAACGQSDDAAGVGGVTVGEARALNEAAEMLDERAEKVEDALQGNNVE